MRVYYTGDIANQPGWFTVEGGNMDDPNAFIELHEEVGSEDRVLIIRRRQIGDRYFGHSNPRFVTEAAREAYYARHAGTWPVDA